MSKTVLIIIVSVVVLFMGMVGAGFFILWNKMSVPAQNTVEAQEEIVEEKDETIGPLYALKTMIVNLADRGGKRYLRVTMELELSDDDMLASVEKRLPQIRDTILMILPTKTYDDISTTQGKMRVRNEIISRINSLFVNGSISNIYFTEFVVQ